MRKESNGANWDKERSQGQPQPVTSEFCPMARPERGCHWGILVAESWLSVLRGRSNCASGILYLILGILVSSWKPTQSLGSSGRVNKCSVNKEEVWQLRRGRPRAAISTSGPRCDPQGLGSRGAVHAAQEGAGLRQPIRFLKLHGKAAVRGSPQRAPQVGGAKGTPACSQEQGPRQA